MINHNDNTYIVQSERKDASCEYCPDAEVTSHGIPEILKSTHDIAISMPGIETQNSTPTVWIFTIRNKLWNWLIFIAV